MLTAEDLAAYAADLWLLSPSCQPYTILNPTPRDSGDPRAKSFLHLVNDVLPSLPLSDALPNRLLVENVAGFEVFHPPSTFCPPTEPLPQDVVDEADPTYGAFMPRI